MDTKTPTRLALALAAAALAPAATSAQARADGARTLWATLHDAGQGGLVRALTTAEAGAQALRLATVGQACCDHECKADGELATRPGTLLQVGGQQGLLQLLDPDANSSKPLSVVLGRQQDDGGSERREIRLRVEIDEDGQVRTHVEDDGHGPHTHAQSGDGASEEHEVHRDLLFGLPGSVPSGANLPRLRIGGTAGPGAAFSGAWKADANGALHRFFTQGANQPHPPHGDGGPHRVERFRGVFVGPDGEAHEFETQGAFEGFLRERKADSGSKQVEKHVLRWVGDGGQSGSSDPFQVFVRRGDGGGGASAKSGCQCCCCGGGGNAGEARKEVQVEVHVERDAAPHAERKSDGHGDVSYGWSTDARDLVFPTGEGEHDVRVLFVGPDGKTREVGRDGEAGVYRIELEGGDGATYEWRDAGNRELDVRHVDGFFVPDGDFQLELPALEGLQLHRDGVYELRLERSSDGRHEHAPEADHRAPSTEQVAERLVIV